MKQLSVVMLAVALNFSLYAMNDYVQARLDLKKKMLTYSLPFKSFLEHIDVHDWETIDDHTAVKLRELSKPLHAVIVAHRNQKLKAYKTWMLSHCESLDDTRSVPLLVIDQWEQWHIEPRSKFNTFLRKTKINLKQNSSLIGAQKWHLEPYSLVIGPSGNRLFGEIYYFKKRPNESALAEYIAAVQFPLCADGSISVANMEPVQRLNNSTKIYNTEFCSWYTRDAGYIRFCSVEYDYFDESGKNRHIIVGGSGNYYMHKDSFCEDGTFDVQFHDGTISVFVRDGVHGFKGEHPYHRVFIEYRFTEGGKHCDHYKHMIASPLSQSRNGLFSLANIEFLPDLQNYLKTCPITTTDIPESTPCFTHPARVITHHYKATETWPLELFERVMKGVKQLTNPDNHKHFDTLSEQWPRSKVSNFVQAALLAGASEYYYAILGKRCRMQRCKTATLWSDYDGRVFYKKDHVDKGVYLYNPIGPVPTLPLYIKEYPVLHDWVTHITEEPVTLKDSLQYLRDHKKDALKLTPAELITLFETRAQQYAQKTWDNGTVGALWEFDTDGMRINIYDLQKQDNHFVGTYLVQGYTAGMVTHVEYVPDAQPIIYIDGQQVDI